jgi:hypothetical protein
MRYLPIAVLLVLGACNSLEDSDVEGSWGGALVIVCDSSNLVVEFRQCPAMEYSMEFTLSEENGEVTGYGDHAIRYRTGAYGNENCPDGGDVTVDKGAISVGGTVDAPSVSLQIGALGRFDGKISGDRLIGMIPPGPALPQGPAYTFYGPTSDLKLDENGRIVFRRLD